MKAIWKGTVLAESDDTVVIEGNHYFPRAALREELFVASDKRTHCPWKGDASYLTVEVDGERNPDAAWFYPDAKEKAKPFEGHVAFWRGVEVQA